MFFVNFAFIFTLVMIMDNAMGYNYTTWQYWVILALFVAYGVTQYVDGKS